MCMQESGVDQRSGKCLPPLRNAGIDSAAKFEVFLYVSLSSVDLNV